VELGDTIENALRQEIREEYSAEIVKSEFLGFRDVHREYEGRKTHWVALDFKVLVERERVKNGEPHKFETLGWFRLEALPTPLHSQLPHALEKYKEKLSS
jgi:ADP-ribose pyrophosphatase YjhB (NUDIX family)